MSRLMVFGAAGSLGSHVLRLGVAAGHQVGAFVRTPSRLPLEAQTQVSVHQGDLSTLPPADLAQLISGHDALINCAGRSLKQDQLEARIEAQQKKAAERREAFEARQNAKKAMLKKNATAAGQALKELANTHV